jgi:hypothetical protein
MSHYIAAYGKMWALHSDNARNLDGAFMRHLTSLLGVVKASTPPHNARSNPTETMCGAVAMLIRKGLQDSDRRYWPWALPLLLNAINDSVHTATGSTPNELFFGRFGENSMIPIVPFEAESASFTEYHQKIRRFQEITFQIACARNEKRIEDRKKEMDKHARKHKFKMGDFVLVKNLNPILGIGKTKLRAKFIGPFSVIKAYPLSLVVIPWTENSRLEEYYKDPDLFRYMHRGSIRPFHTRQVSVKDCKPYKAATTEQKVVDPIVLDKFLKNLNLDKNDELLSVKDEETESELSNKSYNPKSRITHPNLRRDDYSDSDDTDSDRPDQNQGNGIVSSEMTTTTPVVAPTVTDTTLTLVAPEEPEEDAGSERQRAESSDSEESEYHEARGGGLSYDEISDDDKISGDFSDYQLGQLFDLVEVNEEDEQLLKELIEQHRDENESSSAKSEARQKLVDLENLIISLNDEVRRQAEYELRQLLDEHKKSSKEKEETVETEKEVDTVKSDSEEEEVEVPEEKQMEAQISEKSDSDSEEELSRIQEENESDVESVNDAVSLLTGSQYIQPSVRPEDSWPCPSEVQPAMLDRQRQSTFHIDTPGCRITVRPEDLPPIPPPRPREIRGRGRRDIAEWVSTTPDKTPVETSVVNRRGRTIKPRVIYEPEDEEQRNRELRERARQRYLDRSRVDKAEAGIRAQAQEKETTSNPETRSSRRTTRSESEITAVSRTPSQKVSTRKPASVSSRKSATNKEAEGRSKVSRKLQL